MKFFVLKVVESNSEHYPEGSYLKRYLGDIYLSVSNEIPSLFTSVEVAYKSWFESYTFHYHNDREIKLKVAVIGFSEVSYVVLPHSIFSMS